MAAVDDIGTAISNLASKIATESASPRPSYNIDGQNVDWPTYMAMLNDQMDKLLDIYNRLFGPYEFVTQMIPQD